MTIGTKETVREGLEAIGGDYGADEIMIVTITHSHEARKRSYELIAEAFGLQPSR
jgi:alkanesulfonate monooxygenase SsuD/methylene tetrahydromethanopterin reductase-like flavin-dependent oxidoreductase (luciferase family)